VNRARANVASRRGVADERAARWMSRKTPVRLAFAFGARAARAARSTRAASRV